MQFTNTIPALPVNDYQLIIRPAEALRNRIEQVRQQLQQAIPVQPGQLGYNHMLIATFKQFAQAEQRLCTRLRHIFSALSPFKCALHNFQVLPSHTIFMPLVPSTPLTQLIRQVRQQQYLLKAPRQDAFITELPKIVLFQKLQPGQFETLWPMLAGRQLNRSWLVQDLLLLRKRPHERHWQILESMPLLNMPVMATQASLFA